MCKVLSTGTCVKVPIDCADRKSNQGIDREDLQKAVLQIEAQAIPLHNWRGVCSISLTGNGCHGGGGGGSASSGSGGTLVTKGLTRLRILSQPFWHFFTVGLAGKKGR